MKKIIFVIVSFSAIFFSCEDPYNSGGFILFGPSNGYNAPPIVYSLTGTPASFTLIENVDTLEIKGDALPGLQGHFEGPGSAIHENFSYNGDYAYRLECIGEYVQGINISFDLPTSYNGKPIDTLKIGTYNGINSSYRYKEAFYSTFNDSDSVINLQLGTTILITKISEGRIDGSFVGKYYQTLPTEGKIITLKGDFKNVYIFKH